MPSVQGSVQPTITRQPESVLTLQGDNISLSCEADSFPAPFYSWFRQTEEGEVVAVIEDVPRLALNSISGDLVITGVDYSDFGVYFCRATSSSGFADSTSAIITGESNTNDSANKDVCEVGICCLAYIAMFTFSHSLSSAFSQ